MSLSSVLGSRLKRNWAGNVSASTWVDEAGLANATQATSARQPTAITTLAGNGALSFSSDGSFGTNADFMVAPAAGSSATPQFTFACGICRVDPAFGNDGNGCVLFEIGGQCLIYIYPGIDNTLRAAGFGNTAFAWGASAINDGLWHTWSAIWDASAGTVRLYIDGVLQAGNSAGTASSIDLSANDCYFGATDATGVAVYQGVVGNIAVAQDSATFTGDIAAVHATLAEFIRSVQHGTDGAAATGTTSLSVAYPSGIVAGDKLLLAVVNKYPTNGPSTPSGWTLEAQASGGVGTAGADSGTVYTTVFSKTATGSESGSLSVTLTSANSAIGRMLRYTVPSGLTWDIASASGSKNSAGTAFSVTCGSAPGFNAGDVAICFAGTNTDARTYSAETLAASGATFSGMTERQDSVAATGDQCALVIADLYVSSGSSSSAPTFAMTASGTTANQNAGSAVVLRLRAAAGGALSGSVPVGVTFSGTLTGVGALSGATPIAITPVGTLSGKGALVGSVPVGVTFVGTLGSSTSMSGSVQVAVTFSGVLTGAGALAGSVPVAVTPAGTLRGVGSLTGSAPIAISPSGVLSGAGALSGSVPIAVVPAGVLSGSGSLVGSTPLALTFAGTVGGKGALGGSLPIALTFSGTLGSAGSNALSGVVPIGLMFSGQLTGAGRLIGSVPIAVNPSGFLSGLAPLVGSVPISLTPIGTLRGIGSLGGSVTIAVTTSGTLRGTGHLSGAVPISMSPTGLLSGQGALVGVVPISLLFVGTPMSLADLSGSLLLAFDFTGTLSDYASLHIGPARIRWSMRPSTELVVTHQKATDVRVSQQAATSITVSHRMTLYVGDLNNIDIEFRDPYTNDFVDPTSVTVIVTAPSGTVSTLTPTKLEVGKYRCAVPCTEPKTWLFDIVSPGPQAQGARSGFFNVNPRSA